MQAKGFIEGVLGKTVVVERHLRPDVEKLDPIEYAALTGSTTSVCDFTEKRFDLKDCDIISPWAFIESEKHGKLLTRHLERLGEWLEMPRQTGHFLAVRTIAKSWSPWVVHKEFGWDDDPKEFKNRLSLAEYVDDRNPKGHLGQKTKLQNRNFWAKLFSWFQK